MATINLILRHDLHALVNRASDDQISAALNTNKSPLHSDFIRFLAFTFADWTASKDNVNEDVVVGQWRNALEHSMSNGETPHRVNSADSTDDDLQLSPSPSNGSLENGYMDNTGRELLHEKMPLQNFMPLLDIDVKIPSSQELFHGNEKFRIGTRRLNTEIRELLKSKDPLLAEIRVLERRQEILIKKLQLCSVVLDFDTQNTLEIKAIEKKKTILTEILEYISRFSWYSEPVLDQCIKTISQNLFRALPATNDDDEFEDSSWMHLQLIYDLALRLVICTDVDKKTMKKYLEGKFVNSLIELFESNDPREREYLKTILHRIYGRFMPLRAVIRQSISYCCYRSIYEDSRSENGIAEFLEIFCSIIHGFSVPVKDEHKDFLRNVLVPLHKCPRLEKFHEQLVACCVQFVFKDPGVAPIVLGGLLKFWPKQSPIKEEMFITELVNIITALLHHKNGFEFEHYRSILMVVIKKLIECMKCDHHQVAERALAVWSEEAMEMLSDKDRDVIWRLLYDAFASNKNHWNVTLQQTNEDVMDQFRSRDPQLFSEIEHEYEQQLEVRYQIASVQSGKAELRKAKWAKLKLLAENPN